MLTSQFQRDREQAGQFLPTLALVTTVDVVVGRELTFDYAGGAPDDAVRTRGRSVSAGRGIVGGGCCGTWSEFCVWLFFLAVV